MNIVINAIISGENPRGVGVYVNNLIKELAVLDHDNIYYIFYGEWMKGYDFYNVKQENFVFICENVSENKIIRNIYQLVIFPLKVIKYHPDVIHIPDTSPVLLNGRKTVSTIHDLAEYYHPEKYGDLQSIIRKVIVTVQIKMSKKIITISDFSKKTIISRFNFKEENITVIYNGVDLKKVEILDFEESSSEDILNGFGLKKNNYFLFVSELERTKNASVIIDCYNKYFKNSNYKVVLCGKNGNDYENVNSKIEEYGLKDKVVFTGYVTNFQLNMLYANANIFIFPSLFEGFGLPVIEAMANGIPVICSNKSSIPEIGGNAVLVFDPFNMDNLYECILKVSDVSMRKKMVELGANRVKYFTWEKTARKVLEVYKSVKG